MTLRERAPYVALLSVGGALLALHALDAGRAGQWVELGITAVVAAGCALGAVLMALGGGWEEWKVPPWARRYELVGAAVSLRCNQCDTDVLPPVGKVTLPRVMTYAHVHSTTACERNRTAREGGVTDRLSPCRIKRARKG